MTSITKIANVVGCIMPSSLINNSTCEKLKALGYDVRAAGSTTKGVVLFAVGLAFNDVSLLREDDIKQVSVSSSVRQICENKGNEYVDKLDIDLKSLGVDTTLAFYGIHTTIFVVDSTPVLH